MSETVQRTIEKFVHIACDCGLASDILVVCCVPWSDNSPYRWLPGRAIVPHAGSMILDEDELNRVMVGKRVALVACNFEDPSEEQAAVAICSQLSNFKAACLLIAHLLRPGLTHNSKTVAEVMSRHDKMLETGAADVLMDPKLDNMQQFINTVDLTVSAWQNNTDRMSMMLSQGPEPLTAAALEGLQKQHQHLLWDNIPRALMPQLSLVTNVPQESQAGVAQYVFSERFATISGVVTRAIDKSRDDELVAIKIIDKSKIFTPGELEGIYRELRFVSEVLRHPNVASCREHIHTQKYLYMVFDHAGDYTVADLLRQRPQGRLEKHESFMVFRDVVRGLAHCHSKEAAHRNIKLEHVVVQVTPDGTYHCTVVDFRKAVVMRGAVASNTQVGTAPFIAPEAVKGSYLPIAADCWSVGILLLEVAAGLGSTFLAVGAGVDEPLNDFRVAVEHFFQRPSCHKLALTVMGAPDDEEISQFLSMLLAVQPQYRGNLLDVASMLTDGN